MPTRLCAESPCPLPATYRGRCQAHARTVNKATHRNRHIYGSARWRHTRERVLSEQPLCPCGAIAEDVHHVKDLADGGDPWASSNLLGLCKPCHGRITRQEQATR